MEETETARVLRDRKDPPNLERFDALLEERRYFVDKWLETEKSIFIALSAIVAIPTALGVADKWTSNKLAIYAIIMVAFVVVLLLCNRLNVIYRHIENLDSTITFVDGHFSYNDYELRPGRWVKMRQRFLVTNMRRMGWVYSAAGMLLSWGPFLVDKVSQLGVTAK